MPPRKKPTFTLPEIQPGNWRAELVGTVQVNFGQIVQDVPPKQSVEWSYMVIPATLFAPKPGPAWPGVLMITTPMPMKPVHEHAGTLFQSKGLVSLTMSLHVSREQFSDMVRMIETKRLKDISFTVGTKTGDDWPIENWGAGVSI